MEHLYYYIAGGLIILLVFAVIFFSYYKEGLSLSQFPDPTCATCQSCSFYSGGCGTIFQEANKEDEYPCPVANGGFVDYNVKLCPGCGPQVEPLKVEKEDLYFCKPTLSISDSGDTFNEEWQELPCPIPYPPVTPDYKVAEENVLGLTVINDYKRYLDSGSLIISAQDNGSVEKIFNLLVQTYLDQGRGGYADFYYIEGPVLILTRVGKYYYYMYDRPIRYTPTTLSNFVNRTDNWNIVKGIILKAINQMRDDFPLFVFNPLLEKNITVPFPDKSCAEAPEECRTNSRNGLDGIWGPPYGSGNWTLRV